MDVAIIEKKDMRAKINMFESELSKLPGAVSGKELDKMCPLKHTFVDGAYVREIFMPKGSMITSKIHKICHPYFIMKGEVTVVTEEGNKRIKAPYFGITPAGTKRAIYVHEDCTWITVHVTKSKDLKKIEKQIIAKTFDEIDKNKIQLIVSNGGNMLKKICSFINSALPSMCKNKRGTWAMTGAAAIGAGGGILGGVLSKGGRGSPEITQLPEFEEAKGARKLWWEKLQEFGGQPGFGAISPDWADIWEQAKGKVRSFYQGTATQPGALSKVRASAARRGVSDSPALETEITKSLVEQGGQLGDIASQQSLAESQFAESGRQNWLQNLMSLSGQKPSFNVSQPQAQGGGIGEMIAGVSGSIGNAMMAKQQQDWLKGIMKSGSGTVGGPATTSRGIKVPSTFTPKF